MIEFKNKNNFIGVKGVKLYAPPPPNPHEFLGHNQTKCLLSIHSSVRVGIYEAWPQVTC